MIKRILLGLGGTPFTDVAIERATELANDHGSLITGVTVVDTRRLNPIGRFFWHNRVPMPSDPQNHWIIFLYSSWNSE